MTVRSRLLIVALTIFAIAVGVLLGSGPLRSALTGAGSSDEQALEEARAQAEAAQAQADLGYEFADAAGPAAVRGWLTDREVAVVRLANVSEEDAAAASAKLTDAGATMVANAALTDDWDSEDRAAFRDALAAQITDSIEDPPVGATSSDVLAAALAQALVPSDDFVTPGDEQRAQTLWALLVDGGLVTGSRDTGADVVVLVAEDGDVAYLNRALAERSQGAVTAFTSGNAGDTGGVSSVTRAATPYGAWAVTAALIGSTNGLSGQYDASDAPQLIGDLVQ